MWLSSADGCAQVLLSLNASAVIGSDGASIVLTNTDPAPAGFVAAATSYGRASWPRTVFFAKVRKTSSWPRSWANFNLLQLCAHRNAWANLHLLGQPNTFVAQGGRQPPRHPLVRRAGALVPNENDAKLAQKLGQLQPLLAVFPPEYMG